MGLLVGQDPAAKRFELDDAHDTEPRARVAADRIDELVSVDVETRACLTPKDPLRKPLTEESRCARVFVVLRRVRRMHVTSDQGDHVGRVLLVTATLGG